MRYPKRKTAKRVQNAIIFCLLLVLMTVFSSCAPAYPTATPESGPVAETTEVPRQPTIVPTIVPTTAPASVLTEVPQPQTEVSLLPWMTPAGSFFFDPALWEINNAGWLRSRTISDCDICFDCGHGYDPASVTVDEVSEVVGTTSFNIARFIWKDSNEPGFTVINWGANMDYLFEIRSATSGWACYEPAIDVFVQSAERDFH